MDSFKKSLGLIFLGISSFVLSGMITAQELYAYARPLDDRDYYKNKYCYFAKSRLLPYRIITNGEIIHYHLTEEVLPKHIIRFINENGEVLVIPNGQGLILRSVQGKAFLTYGKNLFYGLYDLSDNFEYGSPLVIVEGTLDRDVCASLFYKNTVAMLTSALSKLQIELLKCLTNRVILAYDNDDTGHKQIKQDYHKLKNLQLDVSMFDIKQIKDFGDLAQMAFEGKSFEMATLLSQMDPKFKVLICR